MEKVILKADIREETGKEANNRLRNAGSVPAVVYKKGEKTQLLKVDASELFHILHTSAGENVIITLKIKDAKKEKTVIIKESQHHPIKGNMVHIDFHEISLTEKIEVDIPIETKGEPAGVKNDGGILDQPLKELHIECLPTQIPEKIDVHVEELLIGDAIRVKDLTVPPEITVVNDPEQTVASVVPPKVEEEEPAEGEGEELLEPEVISEKKPEEEAAEGEGKEDKQAPAKEEKKPKSEEKKPQQEDKK